MQDRNQSNIGIKIYFLFGLMAVVSIFLLYEQAWAYGATTLYIPVWPRTKYQAIVIGINIFFLMCQFFTYCIVAFQERSLKGALFVVFALCFLVFIAQSKALAPWPQYTIGYGFIRFEKIILSLIAAALFFAPLAYFILSRPLRAMTESADGQIKIVRFISILCGIASLAFSLSGSMLAKGLDHIFG